MEPSQKQDKRALRRELRAKRAAIPETERAKSSRTINCILKQSIKRGARIGVYWPMGKELELNGFVSAAAKRGAKLYLPYIEPEKRRMWFTPYPADSSCKPERRRMRPKLQVPQFAGKKIRAHKLNLLLVPLVGIDGCGYRLGQAGGYYDATLAALKGRLKPKTVGAGFACQQVCRLPHEPHDIPLDAFVSERGRQTFRRP